MFQVQHIVEQLYYKRKNSEENAKFKIFHLRTGMAGWLAGYATVGILPNMKALFNQSARESALEELHPNQNWANWACFVRYLKKYQFKIK